ncbi:MAG TPA: hypothetical protein ENK18_02750 [Deltaproteobacteria bacterium]|nr:hypothetical protein [Deltaproteobacteria bacterium]
MIVSAILANSVVSAQQPRPTGDDRFEVRAGGARAVITEVGMPRSMGIPAEFRSCRLSFYTRGGELAHRVGRDCHPNLAPEVDEAAALWEIEVTPTGRDRELFEIWYIFPERRGGEIRLFVRQGWDTELRIEPPWISTLNFGLKGIVSPRYPEAAREMDTDITQCDVRVEISDAGSPTWVEASRCDEVFRAAAEDALRMWLFEPPVLDGSPTRTAVTVGVRFSESIDAPDEDAPAWDMLTMSALPRALPGQARIQLPPEPDLGGRRISDVPPPPKPRPPGPLPPHRDPDLVVDHRSFAEVQIYGREWPPGLAGEQERTCDMLFQVDSERRVWAWAEECDPEVRGRSEAAANQWRLVHGRIEPGEVFARFRGTFVFPASGDHPVLRIPEADLVAPERDELPPYLETYAPARAYHRIPPRLPRAFATDVLEDQVVCEYGVRVSVRGRPDGFTFVSCPGAYAPYAERAIGRWRWTPATANGEAIASTTVVRVRFDQDEVASASDPD